MGMPKVKARTKMPVSNRRLARPPGQTVTESIQAALRVSIAISLASPHHEIGIYLSRQVQQELYSQMFLAANFAQARSTSQISPAEDHERPRRRSPRRWPARPSPLATEH